MAPHSSAAPYERAIVDHSGWRLDLARTYIAPYGKRAPIAVLGGSVAQGVANRWSDIDTLVYWDEIDRDWLETPRAAAGGERFTWVEHYPGNACLEQYRFGTPSRPTSRMCGSAGSTS